MCGSKQKKSRPLKNGLSGLMRTRNEAQLIEPCIDSCINALDELIVVCFDCTDDTLEILERKKRQYPTKLRVFEYNKIVLSFDLKKEEFEAKQTILVSTHGAALCAILSHIKGHTLSQFWGNGVQKNCAVTIAVLENGEYRIEEEGITYYQDEVKPW